MFPFWEMVIAPVVRAAGGRRVLEIGALRGETTALMFDQLGPDSELHVIDPLPQFDPAAHTEAFPGRYVFHRALSLDVLADLPPFDVALIDGDHNWYTVFHELQTLAATSRTAGRALPVLLLHDVGWPYGHRDLYYEPSQIPEDYRQPHARAGMAPGFIRLLPEGGLNAELHNAIEGGGPRNGVRRALDDFLEAHDRPCRLVHLPLYFGLAIVVEEERLEANPALCARCSIASRAPAAASVRSSWPSGSASTPPCSSTTPTGPTSSGWRPSARATSTCSETPCWTSTTWRTRSGWSTCWGSRRAPGPTPRASAIPPGPWRCASRSWPRPAGPGGPPTTPRPPPTRPTPTPAWWPSTTSRPPCSTWRSAAFPAISSCAGWVAGARASSGAAASTPTRSPTARSGWWTPTSPPTAGRWRATTPAMARLRADLNQVRDGFERFGLFDQRVRFLQGPYPQSLADAPFDPIAVLRVGVDAAFDIGVVLERALPHLSPGGTVIVEGVGRPIVEERLLAFRDRHGLGGQLDRVDWDTVAWRASEPFVGGTAAAPPAGPVTLHRVPLAPPATTEGVDLSVIVVFYNMAREAPRTLRSLSRSYQQGIDDLSYEVIVVDNGSSPDQRLDPGRGGRATGPSSA